MNSFQEPSLVCIYVGPVPAPGECSCDGDFPAFPKHIHILHLSAIWLGKVVFILPIKVAAQAFDFVLVGVGQGYI